MSRSTPLDLWKTGYQLWWLAAETQATIAMRLMGFSGAWSVDQTEAMRMIVEKPEAFGRSLMAAQLAALQGKRMDEIVMAASKPLRRKTRANAKRLARKGPKFS